MAAELMALLRNKTPRLAKMYHAVLTPEGPSDPALVKAAADVQDVVRVAVDLPCLAGSRAHAEYARALVQ